MEFSNQELCNLLEMPKITRVLRHLNLILDDFPNSRWSQQEVASRIGVDTLNEKCFLHIINSPLNGVFQFVYKYINEEFNYNCLQMMYCNSCYFHCDYMENLKIFGQIGQNEDKFQNRTYTYILKKYYDISQIQIELKEGCENSIKDIRINISRPCNIKNFKKIDSIHHTTILKPALQVQAIQIEFVLDNNNKILQGQCQCGIKKLLDEQKMYCLRCHDNLYVRNIQIQCTASTELNEIQIENEDESQVIKDIIAEQINLLHQKQNKLIEYNINLLEQYRGVRNGKNNISQDMIELYRQFNQSSLLVQLYNNKLQEYYGININQEYQCIFSDCIECSRRLIQKGTCFDDQLLRQIYFSNQMTQKEKDVAIDLLEPNIEYIPQDLDQQQTQEWRNEFILQCHLQLKEVNIEFIKIWMNKCYNIPEVLLSMLQNLLISVLNSGVIVIYQLLDMIQLESISLQNNILSQLYLNEDSQVQNLMNELIITISKNDEILALNILFAQFKDVKNNIFYNQFDQITIEKCNEQIIQYLILFITENHNIDSIQLLNSFKLIQRCWKNLPNQLNYYIQLDEMHSILCTSIQQYSFLNEIYYQLYSTLEIDNKQLLTYFVQSLLKQNQSISQIQRFTHMIHQILFKKLEFKIRAVPHRSTEQHIHKQIEYNSFDFETFDQLKQQIRKDLSLELEFDLIIHDHLIDDTNRSIQLVFKSFYVNFQEKRNHRIESLIRQSEQEFINHKLNKDKRNLPIMIIEFSLQGIGSHDNLPYIPQFYDEQKKILETHLSQYFDFENLNGLFNILKTLHQQGNRFMSTISKIICILKFLSNTPQIKQLIIACHGIILILKVYLKDPQPIFLEFMEDLLQENQILTLRRRFSESLDVKDLNDYNNESADNLKQVLQYLENNSNPRVMQLLCQIIPLIIRDLIEPGNAFMTYFKDRLKLSCDTENTNNSLSIFSSVMYYNPKQYTQLRIRAIESKIYATALAQCIQDMQNSVNCLKIVLSIAKGNQECQEQLLEIGLIQQIFEFANDSREHLKEVSKICDNFIQYIKEEIELVIPQIKELIEELINKKNQQFKQINQNKRLQIMKKFQKSSYEAKINQIQDEKGLFCISCKEGYSTNNSLLGIYIYCNSYQIPDEKVYFQSGGQQIQEVLGIQSVTYFTVIHLQCHKKTVDYAIKQHNKNYDEPIRSNEDFEWECATKNNVAKCNNFFPIKNLTNQNNFESGIELYMRKCEKLCKNKISSKSWLLMNDLKGLIVRIAKLDDLSIDTGAGKYEHNIKFIPLLLNAILQFDISQYSHLFQIPHMNLESLSIAFVAALLSPYKEWKQYKLNLLEQAKTSNYMIRGYYLIDLIMENIMINVKEKQNNYKFSLDQYLCQDQQNILNMFLNVEKQYSLKVRSIQIEELSQQQ